MMRDGEKDHSQHGCSYAMKGRRNLKERKMFYVQKRKADREMYWGTSAHSQMSGNKQ